MSDAAAPPEIDSRLAKVRELLVRAGLPDDAETLARPLGAGRTLEKLLVGGLSPEEAAKPLLSLLRQERALRRTSHHGR